MITAKRTILVSTIHFISRFKMDPKDLDPLYYNPDIIIDTVTIIKSFLSVIALISLLLKFFENGIYDGFLRE